MTFLYYWLVFGLGVYSGALVRNYDSFKGASFISVCRGLMGIPLWPIALYVIWTFRNETTKDRGDEA